MGGTPEHERGMNGSAPMAAPGLAWWRRLGERRALWMGFIAVFVPLAILLALQYRWLTDLERSSSVARRAYLGKLLDLMSKEVYLTYATNAERALNVPAFLLTEGRIEKVAAFFKKNNFEGARRLFVISYCTKDYLLFWNPGTNVMEIPRYSPETVAVWTAAAPWSVRADKNPVVANRGLFAEEPDPDTWIILSPITDDSSKLVGLAGMVLDEGYFGQTALPKAIRSTLSSFSKKDDLVVSVRDAKGREVQTGHAPFGPVKQGVSRALPFVFTDWKITLQDRNVTPERWARRNFALNVTLSLALGAVLLLGIGLALRTASREMRLSAMKSDFVSNVSHELRTPISSIRVFGELMRLGRVTAQDKVREYGGFIETESRRLTQLINNILDFSRIESGRKVYTFEEADIEQVVREAVATFDVRVRAAGFNIDYRAPSVAPPPMRIDRGAIDQAICNLLDNAVKYSGDSREIAVQLEARDGEVVISVADRGIGIPKDEQQRVFDRFHRVSTSLVHDVKGTGLGLSIVQHIVRAHGGSIRLESQPGRGSTFSIHLPVKAPAASAPARAADPRQPV